MIGVDLEGAKSVLGIWVQNTEGAKFWGVSKQLIGGWSLGLVAGAVSEHGVDDVGAAAG